jgi:proline dehydrogenase
MPLVAAARRWASKCVLPLALRAAKAYVAGERLEDALLAADKLGSRGLGVTLGYWDSPQDTPRQVANAYLAGIRALAGGQHAYLSIKVPAIDYSSALLGEIVEQATRHRVRLHFDALAPETADRSRALFEEFLDAGVEMSYTLPGRWARSLRDAAWACERGIVIRVVKGQWADPSDQHRDLRHGFLQVVDALAGRARHVAVASHDVPLVNEAVKRLRESDTSRELELLYGLPMRRSLEQADRLELGVRVYVPYGKSYLPYALSRARSNPRVVWWLVRDLLAARCAPKTGCPEQYGSARQLAHRG